MDKLKYIKLENEDGSYSDSIPIGAEASNVDVDGESVATKLNKKPYCYDTVADMKADTNLTNGQKAYCFGYDTIGDIGASYYYISNEKLTANNLTIIKLDNGLYAKLVYDNKINVANVSVLTSTLIGYFLNNNIEIYTTENIPITSQINITNNNLILKNMKFISNGVSNAVLYINSDNVTVENCFFTGSAGEYIRASGTNTKIINNTFDITNYSVVHPVYVGGENNSVINNNFIEASGFNIQTLNAKKVNIIGNTFNNSHLSLNYVAEGGETSVVFSIDLNQKKYTTRRAVRLNNSIITPQNLTINDNSIIITLNNPLSNGDIINFRGYKSLENININSNTYDINITNNVLKGTGDSGIVIGSDYHNLILDPTHTTSTDYPKRINIANNVITDCAYAGIVDTIGNIKNITIEGNTITNCGWLVNNNGVFNSGIFVSQRSISVSVCNNNISNIIINDGLNESENGVMYNGISLQPNSAANETVNQNIICKNNIISNVNRKVNLYANTNTCMQNIPNIDNIVWKTYHMTNATSPSDYFGFGTNNAGAGLDTTTYITGTNSISALINPNGYVGISLKNIKNLKGLKLVRVKFFAKNNGNGKVRLLLQIPQAAIAKSLEVELTKDWEEYYIGTYVSDISVLELRLVATNQVQSNIHISDIEFDIGTIYNY